MFVIRNEGNKSKNCLMADRFPSVSKNSLFTKVGIKEKGDLSRPFL